MLFWVAGLSAAEPWMREGHGHISPLNKSLVLLRMTGIQMERFISHRRGTGGGGVKMCVFVLREEYKWNNVFTTERGCERKNWPSTELWFHFGDIESLDQTSEATKEQFSVPITAHSSWCDCCVAVISLVGGRRAAAESLHKTSLPVALASRLCLLVCPCAQYLWTLNSI